MDENYAQIPSIKRWCLLFASVTVETNNILTTTSIFAMAQLF
jgi:hypothetical protein